MSSAEQRVAEVPPQRRRRVHPCTLPFLAWSVYLACAVIVAVAAASPLWLLVGIPSLLFCYTLGASISRGYPNASLELAKRFDRILIDVEGIDSFSVIAQDQTSSPCMLRRRRKPLLIASRDFVEGASDAVLRGLAALQHAELRDVRMTRRATRSKVLLCGAILAVAIGAAAVSPRHTSGAAALASVGLSVWFITAIQSAWSRTARAAKIFEEPDREAARLVGGEVVAESLLAMRAWRVAYRERLPLLTRIVYACVQPIAPSWHAAERARRLREDSG